jgi:hypothetical protein
MIKAGALTTRQPLPVPANSGCGCPDVAAFGHGHECPLFGGWRIRTSS